MIETKAMLATVMVVSILVGLVSVSSVMIVVGLVAGVALLVHETRL